MLCVVDDLGGRECTEHITLLLNTDDLMLLRRFVFVDPPKCVPFLPQSYQTPKLANTLRASHHKYQVQRLSIPIGERGYDVVDLHNVEDLLGVFIGETQRSLMHMCTR